MGILLNSFILGGSGGIFSGAGSASGSGIAEIPYTGPLAQIDFIAGTATISGASVSMSAVIDHPELVSGSGLDVSTTLSKLIGAMKTLWLSRSTFTVIVDYDIVGGFGDVIPFIMQNPTSSAGVFIEQFTYTTNVSDFGDGSFFTGVNYVDAAARQRVVFTRTAGNIAVSVNGGSVNSGSGTPNTLGYLDVYLGGSSWWGASPWPAYIRELTLMVPQADGDLPTLSTIP